MLEEEKLVQLMLKHTRDGLLQWASMPNSPNAPNINVFTTTAGMAEGYRAYLLCEPGEVIFFELVVTRNGLTHTSISSAEMDNPQTFPELYRYVSGRPRPPFNPANYATPR